MVLLEQCGKTIRRSGNREIGRSGDRVNERLVDPVIVLIGRTKSHAAHLGGPGSLLTRSSDLRISRSLRNDSFAHGVQDQFGKAMQVEFILKVPAVGFDGVETEVKQGCNILIRLAFRQQVQDLSLP